MEKFGKAYKLCSRKQIQLLFDEGTQVRAFPFTIYFRLVEEEIPVPFQTIISVPKRIWKKAHDRNAIKRLMREVIRKNKGDFENILNINNQQANLCFVYTHSSKLSYLEMEKSILKGFKKLIENNEKPKQL